MGGKSSKSEPKSKGSRGIEELMQTWKSGDMLALRKEKDTGFHFAVLTIPPDECKEPVPPLAIYGSDHPVSKETLKIRVVNVKSAMTLMFQHGYTEVLFVNMGLTAETVSFEKLLSIADEIRKEGFSPDEQALIDRLPDKNEVVLSLIANTLTVASIYSKLGISMKPISEIVVTSLIGRPAKLLKHLGINGTYQELNINKPKNILGPVSNSKPAPLFTQLIDGIVSDHVPKDKHVPLESIANDLQTGDLVLMSGMTSGGAIIKLFENEPFSHVGVVVRSSYTPEIFIWESSTNRANLPDLKTGTVHQGVEILPLKQKMYSGWYGAAAVRRLVGLGEEERREIEENMYKFMKEVANRVYETDKIQLILSSIDFMEGKIDMLSNTQEDLSTLFCSEAIAALYQRAGLLSKEKISNTYSVRDFHSHFKLELLKGRLEKEVYLELKL
ncbi:hypothetical protein LOD99_5002 [Oopsacas minuta]|uniref:Uncharacterized protein n=1 Tax=Oopsacas minuta TaxID=111878 RepID=A0AAV7JT93_9METZ|nr:hypothetical protein LOD99_5002 [Oopsacas minuta]